MNHFEIETIDLTNKAKVEQVRSFLFGFDLMYENVDTTIVLYHDNKIIGTCSKLENLVKCLAISDEFKNYQLTNLLITKISKMIYQENYHEILLITKPKNKKIFLDLNFFVILENDDLVFFTTNLAYYQHYKNYLITTINDNSLPTDKLGIIVMNANPFTKGHEYLINETLKQVDHLFVLVVKEDKSLFSYEERKTMILLNTKDNPRITVLEGSDYLVSNKIFPSYFANSFQQASEFHARLDTQIFCNLFEDFNNRLTRFVGDEPFSQTTRIYNQVLSEVFAAKKMQFKIIPRLEIDGQIVSASTVRKEIFEHQNFDNLVPASTAKFLQGLNIYQRAQNHENLIAKNN